MSDIYARSKSMENTTIRWEIERNKITRNNTIHFCEVIWDCDIDLIINFCKTEEIIHITISSNFSSLITSLAVFEKQGCIIGVLQKLNRNIMTGKQEHLNVLPQLL